MCAVGWVVVRKILRVTLAVRTYGSWRCRERADNEEALFSSVRAQGVWSRGCCCIYTEWNQNAAYGRPGQESSHGRSIGVQSVTRPSASVTGCLTAGCAVSSSRSIAQEIVGDAVWTSVVQSVSRSSVRVSDCAVSSSGPVNHSSVTDCGVSVSDCFKCWVC